MFCMKCGRWGSWGRLFRVIGVGVGCGEGCVVGAGEIYAVQDLEH